MVELGQLLGSLSIRVPVILLALTFHEYAHGLIADRLGDPTPRFSGRLTLNPLSHLDPIGTLALFLAPVGWAKPVPVNPLNFTHPRRDMMWVAAAGPCTNLFLATLSAVAVRFLEGVRLPEGGFFLIPLLSALHVSVLINVGLALFNLLPIPPLDGGRVLSGLLPPRRTAFIERYGFLILLILIMSGVVNRIIGPAIFALVGLLLG